MPVNPVFDTNRVNLVLQAALGANEARHRAVVNNIANVDTPGYKRIEVHFEEELQKAEKRMNSRSGTVDWVEGVSSDKEILSLRPAVRVDPSPPLRADGSNVGIDREMAELSKTRGKSIAMIELLSRNYRDIKAAIRGRNV